MHELDERRFDTPQTQRDQVREALGSALAAESDVAFAFIHGSFLTERPFHDIDIAVYLVGLDASQISLRTLALAESLETTVFRANGIRPHPPIDVRPLNPAPPITGIWQLVTRDLPLSPGRYDARTLGSRGAREMRSSGAQKLLISPAPLPLRQNRRDG